MCTNGFLCGPLGGWKKISGIVYADGSEIPKRSRQSVWRAAVEMSKNASQLALQVCYYLANTQVPCSLRPSTFFIFLFWPGSRLNFGGL